MIDPFRNLDGRKSLALIICVSLIVTVGFGVLRGQDFNWDQRNYHIGVAHLLYQDRFWSSVTPAGVQSYFNPYLHQIQYFGIRHLPPIVFGILLSVVQSLGFILAGVACLIIARSSAHGFEQREKNVLGLLGFALCMLAPIALSMAGTTFIDLVTAVPIIAAYTLLLARDQVGLMRAAVLAGLLIGMATALKLTNGVFAFGVLGFALAGTDSWRQRIWWLLIGAFAVFTAFLAVGGVAAGVVAKIPESLLSLFQQSLPFPRCACNGRARYPFLAAVDPRYLAFSALLGNRRQPCRKHCGTFKRIADR